MTALTLLAAMAPLAAPQTVVPVGQGQGMFTNLAVGMLLDEGGAASRQHLVIRKPAHDPSQPPPTPVPWSASAFGAASDNHPDFSRSRLLDHWWNESVPPASVLPGMKWGGVSTGGDVMPAVGPQGEFLPSGGWVAVQVTVDQLSEGLPGSNVEAVRNLTGGHPEGWVFSYYAEGNQQIDEEYVDSSRVEFKPGQLRFADYAPAGSPSPGPMSLSDLDTGLGMISIDPTGRAGSMFPVRNRFYFTIAKEWIDAVSALSPSLLPTVNGQPVDARTVYGMTWGPSAGSGTLEWSQPWVAFASTRLFDELYAQLGGAGTVTQADIDRLDIDAISVFDGDFVAPAPAGEFDGPARIVFSLTPESDGAAQSLWFDPLLVYQRAPSEYPTKALATSSGATASSKLGLRPRTQPTGSGTGRPSNPKGVCIGDPDETMAGPLNPIFGIPFDDENSGNPGLSGVLGLSVCRTLLEQPSGEPVPRYAVQASGFDLGGYPFGVLAYVLLGDEAAGNGAQETVLQPTIALYPGAEVQNEHHWHFGVAGDKDQAGVVRLRADLYVFDPLLNQVLKLRESSVITFEYAD